MSIGFFKVFLFTISILLGCFVSLKNTFVPLDQQTSNLVLNHIIQSNFISTDHLLISRIICTIVVYSTVLVLIFNKNRSVIPCNNLDLTIRTVRMDASNLFATFTVWSWNLQGIYFLSTLYLHLNNQPSSIIIQTTAILFEVCFAVAMLVTIVVTFILIPVGMKRGQNVQGMFKPQSLIMHNLNMIFMVMELIWNQIQIDLTHLPFVILYGLTYVVFAWIYANIRGYFFYFFLNYNQPRAILMHSVLVFALSLFYVFAYLVTLGFNPEDNPLAFPLLIIGTLLICRFRVPNIKPDSAKH